MRILSLIFLFFISGNLLAQECTDFYLLNEGKQYEMTSYNKRGKVQGRQTMTVKELKRSNGKVTSMVDVELFDDKNKSVSNSSVEIECDNGVILMNMKLNLPSNVSNTSATATATSGNQYAEYPPNMQVGDQLRDAEMEMDIETNGMKQNLKMFITNRKVEGKETITSPAGTWEAFKITSNTRVEMTTMGIKIPVNIESTEYFVPGFGMVKSESKQGYTLLTGIK